MINHDNSLSSKIRISCRKEEGRTRLTDSFFTIPYKLAHYGKAHACTHLEMIIMSASPGVMEGDSLELLIDCKDQTEMKLYTQSYNKIHPMPLERGAHQQLRVRLGKNALFQYIPHPTIPFEQSIFKAVNQIGLAEDAHLIWSDIVSGGRIHSGERFLLSNYQSLTKVFRNKRLVFYDNLRITPAQQPVEGLLFFEGYTHQATFVVQSPFADALKKEIDEMLTVQADGMTYGYTSCSPGGIMLRALANSGDQLHNWFTNLANMCWDFIMYHRHQQPMPQPGKQGLVSNGASVRKSPKAVITLAALSEKQTQQTEPAA